MSVPVGVKFLDEEEERALIQTERDFRAQRRKRSEVVIYYRRPRDAPAQKGWIMWAASQDGIRSDYVMRGFIPLPQFGRIWDGDSNDVAEISDRNARLYIQHGPWAAILSHPQGPEQFPVDQIITFRWYRPELIGSPGQAHGPTGTVWTPIPNVRFPQLREWEAQGNEIVEYPCPECADRNYLEPIHLARHLHNSHSWDRADVIAWGTAMGIDFSKEFGKRLVRVSYSDIVRDQIVPDPVAGEAPPSVKLVETPTLAEVRARSGQPSEPKPETKPCGWCLASKSGTCKKHRRKRHK